MTDLDVIPAGRGRPFDPQSDELALAAEMASSAGHELLDMAGPAQQPTDPPPDPPAGPPGSAPSRPAPGLNVRSMLRLAGVLLALALAFGAQYLFEHPDQGWRILSLLPLKLASSQSLASLLLLLGAVLFAVAAPALAVTLFPGRQISPEAIPASPPAGAASALSSPAAILSLAVYVLCLGLYLAFGESAAAAWVGWLWLSSVVLLVASQISLDDVDRLVEETSIDWRSLGWLALILLVAGVLRFYRLSSLPQDLHGDMASHGMQARVLLDGAAGGLVGVGWADIPLLGFLPAAAGMALTGDRGMLGLNLASAIGGLLSVLGLYALMAQLAGRRAALLAAALLATAYTHIHFSRIAEYMDPVPLAVWSLAFLALGLRSRHGLPFVLSGILLALTTQMYFSGRVALIVAELFLLHLLLFRGSRRVLWENRFGLLAMAAGMLLALGPQLVYFLQHTGPFLSRTQAVILTNPDVLTHLKGKYGVDSLEAVLLEQIRRSLLMFSLYADSSTQFGIARPLVDSLTAPLVALGFGYALRHWLKPATFLLAAFLGSILVVGGILTNNAPFWPRLVMITVPAAAVAALALDRAWEAVTVVFDDALERSVIAIVAGLLIYIALQNWLIYYPFAAHNGWPRAIAGRAIEALPPTAAVCLVSEAEDDPGAWIHSTDEREIAFFIPPRPAFDVTPEQIRELAGPAHLTAVPAACSRSGAAWLVPRSRQYVLPQLEITFPGGRLEEHGRRAADVVLYSYVLP